MHQNIIGSYNADISKNAYLNWRTDKCAQTSNMVVFAQAYYMAAMMIADNILENNSGHIADALIFLMLFDTNQFVELYLKALQTLLNVLLGHEEKFDGGHNLIGHYGKFISLLNEFERGHPSCKGDRREFNEMMSSVSDYMDELKTCMPESSRKSMDFPRYPVMSDKHTNQFYIEESGNVTVDICYFKSRIDSMQRGLDSLVTYFENLVQYVQDAQRYSDWV